MWDTHVRVLESTEGAFAYLIVADEMTLVDTGLPWRCKAIMEEFRSLGVRPERIRHILLTHYDMDHIGNAACLQRLTGATVWASAVEIPYILGEKPRPGFKRYMTKIVRCEQPLDIHPYGDTLPGGEIKVISTPGHTPGHVCLLHEEVLFAGDIVQGRNDALRPYPAPWNWNGTLMADSIRKLNDLSFRRICPAHGRPVDREAWDRMAASLLDRRARKALSPQR